MLLEIAAFRLDRDPSIIQTLNDIAWMMLIGMGATAILQPFVVAVAILHQRPEDERVFVPRWLGYFSLWAATLFLPGPLCVFFKSARWPGTACSPAGSVRAVRRLGDRDDRGGAPVHRSRIRLRTH